MDDLHAPTVGSGPTTQSTGHGLDRKLTFPELIAKKENLEAELSALGSVLDSHGVHMNTSLLTFDGFPRPDLDIAQIRTTRARIVRLKNDYKAVMAKLEVAVHEQFAAGKAVEMPAASSAAVLQSEGMASTGSAPVSAGSAIEPSFARVNTVVPSSPAEQAGLRVGDRVTRFGTVNWMNHERLGRVAQVVQQNENHVIQVKILREAAVNAASQPLVLQLTPRRDWGGRGLLGCHLLPL